MHGKLFEEALPMTGFNATTREALLDCCSLDWGTISPAIFGSLFQSVMDAKARRNLGVHYTSEQNILKVIKPLFLDDLRAEFDSVKGNWDKLIEFRKKLRTLTFFDPACGCGNFLVIAFRELRLLELDVLRVVFKNAEHWSLGVQCETCIGTDQFYGIEIEEFPAQIAKLALWLVDHQMNARVSDEFGWDRARTPPKNSPHIVHGNALTLDWNDVLPSNRATYVFGNPPFVGGKHLSAAQRKDSKAVFAGIEGSGLLDFVAAWFVKAAKYMTNDPPAKSIGSDRAKTIAELPSVSNRKSASFSIANFRFPATGSAGVSPALAAVQGLHVCRALRSHRCGFLTHHTSSQIRCAFVSTNSITQGEQVGVLWCWLLSQGIRIQFAHRAFRWRSEARGVAAVHCVIIGFGMQDLDRKVIYEYDDADGEPAALIVSNINPYLVDAPNTVLLRRSAPLCAVPTMRIGNKPIDDGNYLFTDEEKTAFLEREPKARPFFRRWLGAHEFINNAVRWCLWLGEATSEELRAMPLCLDRVESVRRYRLGSQSAPTRKLAACPTRFHVEFLPADAFLLIPRVSAERREWIPVGVAQPDVMGSDAILVVPSATVVHFAILSSTMHNAWLRIVCGRLESRYRYSASIVYNNFPWPDTTDTQRAAMACLAQGILDARASYPESTLAELYDPRRMPSDLRKAHLANDLEVDAAYGYQGEKSDTARVAFLFRRYCEICNTLPPKKTASHQDCPR